MSKTICDPCGARGIRLLPKRVVQRVLLLLVLSSAPSVQAALPVSDRLMRLTALPGFIWQEHEVMRMSGVPVYIKSFSSSHSVLNTAQALAKHDALFQRVLKINNKVMLSGLQSRWHWLAEIDAAATGSTGYVSALRIQDTHESATSGAQPSLFAWLPPQSHRQFDYRSGAGARQVVQQVYSVPLRAQELTAYVRKQLRIDGLVPERDLALTPDSSTWRLGGARLALYPQSVGDGTSLYIHYVE